MSPWKQAMREGAVSGTTAGLLSAAVLVAAGRRENGSAAAPVNAISHWIWPRSAFAHDEPSLRHTAVGLLVHQGASIFWGTLHARAWGMRPQAKRPGPALAGGLAGAAVACFVDFQMTPDRLTPGFEHRLSRGSLALAYAAFGIGLALGSLAMAARAIPRRRTQAKDGVPAGDASALTR